MAYFDQSRNQATRPTLRRHARSAYTAPEASFAPALKQPSFRIPRVPVPQHPAKGMRHSYPVTAMNLPKNEHHVHGTEACLLTKVNAHTPLASLLEFTTKPEIVADIKPVTPVIAFAQNENIDTSAHMPDKPLSLHEDEYGDVYQRTYTAVAPSPSKTVFRPSPLRNALQLSDPDGEDKVQPWAHPSASPSPPSPPQKDARPSSRFRTQHESPPGIVEGKKREQQDSGKGDAFREDPSDHSQACASSVAPQYQNQEALMAVCKTSLTASQRARWIVSADIDLLTRAKAVDRLSAAREEQEKPRLKYRDLQTRRDRDSTDPATLVSWYRLVALIEHKMIDEGRFEQLIKKAWGADRIVQAQEAVMQKITHAISEINGFDAAKQIMIRLNLPMEHDSISFDCRRTEAWKIVRANMPFGPTIDDCGAPVSHYVLYTCLDLYRNSRFQGPDEDETCYKVVGGLMGFPAIAIGLPDNQGHSGEPGVVDIEMAIKTRFNPEKYRICWLLPPQRECEKTGLQCIHIWVSEKRTPSLLHMLKIRKYLKKLNKGWDGSKERKSIWRSLGCVADIE